MPILCVIISLVRFIWDYDPKKLAKSKQGRLLLLERQINYGPGRTKIKLSEVKKNWNQLQIDNRRRSLLKLLIWGK